MAMALGLGRTVVDGGRALSFSPKHPAAPPALLHRAGHAGQLAAGLHRRGDGAATAKARPSSTTRWPWPRPTAPSAWWPPPTVPRTTRCTTASRGRACVWSASPPSSSSRALPLPAVFDRLMELGRWGMNTEVEIEFAVELSAGRGQAHGVRLSADAPAGPVARAGGARHGRASSPSRCWRARAACWATASSPTSATWWWSTTSASTGPRPRR